MTSQVPDFRNHLPVRIDFGNGSIDRIGDALLADGALELLVTGVRDRSIVDALLQ